KLPLGIRRACGRTVLRHSAVEGKLVDVGQLGGLGLSGTLAVGVDERVREYSEEPRLEIGAGRELLAEAQRSDIRLLHEVLGVGLRSCHPERRSIERVNVGERVSLERILRHS